MNTSTKVLLIGGTSHVGKSTLGKRLALEMGWNNLSTDQLARHPGRPWRNDQQGLPDDVVAHYSQRSATGLVDSVLQHYQQNVWPIIDAIVRSHLNNPFEPSLVFEGSAMLPESICASQFQRCKCVWLTASEDVIRQRIIDASRFETRAGEDKQLIDAFIGRTLAFNTMVVESATKLGQRILDASSSSAMDQLASLANASPD